MSTTERNKEIWTKNLITFQESHYKRRTITRKLKQDTTQKPKLFLEASTKERKNGTKEITKAVTSLWQKKLTTQVIQAKLN